MKEELEHAPAGHACLVYADDAQLAAHATAFLAEGVAADERLLYVGDRPSRELLEHLAGLPDAPRLLRDGVLAVMRTEDVYDATRPIDPDRQLALYRAVVREALEAGFSGVRVVADGTPIARRPELVAPLRRWEHVADRWIAAGVPLSALCVLDRRVVPAATVAQLTCVHRHAVPEEAPFHVVGDAVGAALGGEVDAFTAPLLRGVLADLGGEVTDLDLADVAFLDHHALAELIAHAERHGGLTVRHAPSPVRRLLELVELPGRDAVRLV